VSDPIAARVEAYIVEQFLGGEGPVEHEEDLFAEGVLDSFGFMLVLTFLQESFGVQVQMRDITMDRFDTIAKIAAQVRAAGGR
jgi:acyl carrier protein